MVLNTYRNTKHEKIYFIIETWKAGAQVTDRQKNIWQSIVNAYSEVKQLHDLSDEKAISELYYEYEYRAEKDELKTIHDIAFLFFLSMFKWGV